MSITGTVVKWATSKGWGFVKSNADDAEYYVHHTAIQDGVRLTEGAEVQFDADLSEPSSKKEKEYRAAGKKRAANVCGLAVVPRAQGSSMGTVTEWHLAKEFGYILGVDGGKVYVHASAFEGAKLQVGKTVTYDAADVQHPSGRKVAVNVAGPAVMQRGETAGQVLSWLAHKGYGFAQDAAGTQVFIHAKEIDGGWLMEHKQVFYDAVPKEGDTSGKLVATNVSGPAVRDAEQAAAPVGKGGKGVKGYPIQTFQRGRPAGGAKSMGGEEQRKDVDGNYYTKAQFIEQYGGTDQWDAKETRCSPANGMYYPKEKFIAFFGGTKEWNRARPNSSSGAAPFNPLGAKRRGRGGGFASA